MQYRATTHICRLIYRKRLTLSATGNRARAMWEMSFRTSRRNRAGELHSRRAAPSRQPSVCEPPFQSINYQYDTIVWHKHNATNWRTL